MIAVKVMYTVKQSYVETNKENIKKVMSELKALDNPGIKYSSFMLNDGKTFCHFGMYSDENALSQVTQLTSFKEFQNALKESLPGIPPKDEDLNLVPSAYDIF